MTRERAAPEQVNQAVADARPAWVTNEPKTFWDYRAVAAVHAARGDFDKAAKTQVEGKAILRQTGSMRFLKRAAEQRERYTRSGQR